MTPPLLGRFFCAYLLKGIYMKQLEQQYVLTEDTTALFRTIDQNPTVGSQAFQDMAGAYLQSLSDQINLAFDNQLNVQAYRETEIEQRLGNAVEKILTTDPNTVCVCLDRFLLSGLEAEESQFKDRFMRFSIARTIDGQRVPRPGSLSFEDQMRTLKEFAQDKKIVLVDDGLFTGGTVNQFREFMNTCNVDSKITTVLAFMGPDTTFPTGEDEPEYIVLAPTPNLYDWIDTRDFSPLGGKRLAASRSNRIATATPYIAPWSEGESASLAFSPRLFDVSSQMIKQFQLLVQQYEQGSNKPLTFRDLLRAGYPLPTNAAKTIPVFRDDTVTEYLDRCIKLIEWERNREVMIFDMDGTLYQLDGENNGFRGSTLERTVQANALLLIQEREQCSLQQAEEILAQASKNPVGISASLSEKYGISRSDYFNRVWNINPEGIVKNGETIRSALPEFQREYPETKFILLTSAPRIWANNVLAYLGADRYFEAIYTGEQYGTKAEIFRILAGRYNPDKMLSVGDQEETDILPALQCGMNEWLIENPNDLKDLLIRKELMYVWPIWCH